MNAIEAIGGSLPLKSEEFARRAHAYALNPNRNPLKEVLDQAGSVEDTPPLLGIFNDIPWHRFRESEAHARHHRDRSSCRRHSHLVHVWSVRVARGTPFRRERP